ncbi:MAG: diguanylate cyclase [Telmatospirillum sp.]|nr:diguanylate cyclase [Telmatospirillum sp.]
MTGRKVLSLLAVLCLFIVPLRDVLAADAWDRLAATVFTNLGRDAGLPHPVVMALAQDGDGFLWVGTQGGLSRFDGYRFRTFYHHDDAPFSLPANSVAALLTDSGGRLGVGTMSGGVALFDPRSEHFRSFPAPAGKSARTSVLRLCDDGAGGVWVATNSGLDHIDPGSGTVTREVHRADDARSLPNDRVRTLLRTRDGTLWVATFQGLVRRLPGTAGFEKVPVTGDRGQTIEDVVTSMIEDSAGRIWFATSRSGLGRIDPSRGGREESGSARLLGGVGIPAGGLPVSFALVEGRPGEIWVGRVSGGITVIDAATGKTRTIRHDATLQGSLGDDTVRALLRDKSGLIWAGTNVGVSRTNLHNDAIDTILPASGTPEGLPEGNVLAVSVGADGKAWLGLKDAGVAVLDPHEGRIATLPGGAGLGTVLAIASGPGGAMWIGGTSGRALFRVDPLTGVAERHPLPIADAGPILFGIWHDGALWLAAGPLIRFDPATGTAQVFRHGPDPASLIDDSTNCLLPAADGGLWVATRHGLEHFDPTTGTFRHFTHDARDPTSLPEDLVATLLLDRKGHLWVGTLGGAIGVLENTGDLDHAVFRRIGTAEGMPNANTATLLEADDGHIWASTADGIAVIDPDSYAVRPLGFGDGVAIPAYWIHSGARLSDGTLLFGGGGGATVVHPDRLGNWRYVPPTVITRVRVGGTPVAVDPKGGGQPLLLDPPDRNIEVEFASLDYSAPDRLKYMYKLDGFDGDWVSTDVIRRVAAYTNLAPAAYRLMVKGTNRDGTETEPVILPIIVRPSWWQTWWARAFAVVAGLAVMVGLIHARTAFLDRRRRHLEDLVARQTRDLTEANRRLEELASRDPLTGILNRRRFLEQADRDMERARRQGHPVSLLMIDVDHFKRINDSYGHAAGDKVLCAIVDGIGSLLRATDLFARWGGEEMTVLMPETDAPSAKRVAERLRLAISHELSPCPGDVAPVTISVGLATMAASESLSSLLERADKALYEAKRAGRDRVVEAAIADEIPPVLPPGR